MQTRSTSSPERPPAIETAKIGPRRWRLLRDWRYPLPNGGEGMIRAGTETDGVSGFGIVASNGDGFEAAFVHDDRLTRQLPRPHRAFHFMLRLYGFSRVRAGLWFLAVVAWAQLKRWRAR